MLRIILKLNNIEVPVRAPHHVALSSATHPLYVLYRTYRQPRPLFFPRIQPPARFDTHSANRHLYHAAPDEAASVHLTMPLLHCNSCPQLDRRQQPRHALRTQVPTSARSHAVLTSSAGFQSQVLDAPGRLLPPAPPAQWPSPTPHRHAFLPSLPFDRPDGARKSCTPRAVAHC